MIVGGEEENKKALYFRKIQFFEVTIKYGR
jgi:hypothetical protein